MCLGGRDLATGGKIQSGQLAQDELPEQRNDVAEEDVHYVDHKEIGHQEGSSGSPRHLANQAGLLHDAGVFVGMGACRW